MGCDKKVPSITNNKRINCHHYVPSTDGVSSGLCMVEDNFICSDDLYASVPRLSHSALTDWMVCHRLYYLKHIMGIAVKPSACSVPMKLGSLWDQCIQVLVGGAKPGSIQEVVEKYEISSHDVAKVRALYKSCRQLGLQFDPSCDCQYVVTKEFNYKNGPMKYMVKGIFDRRYDTWIAETKLSGRPDWYSNLFNITPQIGIYFLLDESVQYAKMEVTRVPDLRTIKGQGDETDEEYEDRCIKDIMSRPAHYFQGWDRDMKIMGRKFHRGEFPLDEIRKRLDSCFHEIMWASMYDDYYKNYKSCYGVGQCEYYDVCQHNTISEEIYEIKDK